MRLIEAVDEMAAANNVSDDELCDLLSIDAARLAGIRAGVHPPHPALCGGMRALAKRLGTDWASLQAMAITDRRRKSLDRGDERP